jgi:hypothetical protein
LLASSFQYYWLWWQNIPYSLDHNSGGSLRGIYQKNSSSNYGLEYNWRKQSGVGHDWTMLQLLAKVDLEYLHLVNLNQWKMNDPNSNIVALCAEISDLKIALQAAKLPSPTGQAKQKSTWVPKEGQPLEVFHNNKKWKYCGHCNYWNQTHTSEHKSKADLHSQQPSQPKNGGPSANLASSGQPATPSGGQASGISTTSSSSNLWPLMQVPQAPIQTWIFNLAEEVCYANP